MTKEEAIDLITDAGYGMLATVEGDQPRVRPMMPYYDEDNNILIIALLGQSRTIGDVKNNPKVEVCFVDRKMWFARVTGTGQITNNKEYKETLFNNVPMLRQYFGSIDDPNFILLEVKVSKLEASTPHQKQPETIAI